MFLSVRLLRLMYLLHQTANFWFGVFLFHKIIVCLFWLKCSAWVSIWVNKSQFSASPLRTKQAIFFFVWHTILSVPSVSLWRNAAQHSTAQLPKRSKRASAKNDTTLITGRQQYGLGQTAWCPTLQSYSDLLPNTKVIWSSHKPIPDVFFSAEPTLTTRI